MSQALELEQHAAAQLAGSVAAGAACIPETSVSFKLREKLQSAWAFVRRARERRRKDFDIFSWECDGREGPLQPARLAMAGSLATVWPPSLQSVASLGSRRGAKIPLTRHPLFLKWPNDLTGSSSP